MNHHTNSSDILMLNKEQGRVYDCGTMTSIFKADENETSENYSISEWWLEANSHGPGAHSHDANDEVFYGIKGITSILVGDQRVEIKKGTFIRIPAKTVHDFANHTHKKSGVLNFFIPGGFEKNMPAIVEWFRAHPNAI